MLNKFNLKKECFPYCYFCLKHQPSYHKNMFTNCIVNAILLDKNYDPLPSLIEFYDNFFPHRIIC